MFSYYFRNFNLNLVLIEFSFCLNSLGSDPNSLASAYMSTAGLPQFGSAALTTSPLASVALSTAAAAAAGKQIEGKSRFLLFCN